VAFDAVGEVEAEAYVEFPDLAQWKEAVQDERVKDPLALDRDGGDRIVRSWSAAVRNAFLARGTRLIVSPSIARSR
jgi:hypothetical protein